MADAIHNGEISASLLNIKECQKFHAKKIWESNFTKIKTWQKIICPKITNYKKGHENDPIEYTQKKIHHVETLKFDNFFTFQCQIELCYSWIYRTH